VTAPRRGRTVSKVLCPMPPRTSPCGFARPVVEESVRNHARLQVLLQLAFDAAGEDVGGPRAAAALARHLARASRGPRAPQQQFLGCSRVAVVLGREAESGAPCPSRETRLTRACAHRLIGAWAAVARASRTRIFPAICRALCCDYFCFPLLLAMCVLLLGTWI
jgi:hypothetical protein